MGPEACCLSDCAVLDSPGVYRKCLGGHRLPPTKAHSPLGQELERGHSVPSDCLSPVGPQPSELSQSPPWYSSVTALRGSS